MCVQEIIELENNSDGIMIGDSVKDLEAARLKKLNFLGILKYSDRKRQLNDLVDQLEYQKINSFKDLF